MHRSIRTQCNIIISFHVNFLKPIYSSVFLSVLSEGLKKERHCVLISLSSSLVSLFASVLSASICALLFRSSNLYPLFPIYVDCSYQFISRYTTPKWKRGYFRHRLTVLPLAHAVQVYKDPVNQTHFIFFSLSLIFLQAERKCQGKAADVGFAMSVVTASMPLAYTTLYPWIGLLEQMTGMVSISLWLGVVYGTCSALLFAFLKIIWHLKKCMHISIFFLPRYWCQNITTVTFF